MRAAAGEDGTRGVATNVTVAVVPRERFSFAVESLRSILANTSDRVPIVYVDGRSPADVSSFAREQAGARPGFKYLRFDRYLSPNEARNRALEHVGTEFVVFVDNDLVVEPGWLDAMVSCAMETGAALVGPLYLEGTVADDRIHMAGGFARIETHGSDRYLKEGHFHPHKKRASVAEPLSRQATELLEFHCMLARTELLRRLGKLDEALLSLHEHVDLCLSTRAAGGLVMLEPSAVVRYSFEGRLRLAELPYISLRWSDRWNESTLSSFKVKWNLCDADPSLPAAMRFGRNHRRMLIGQFLPRRLRHSRFGLPAIRFIDTLALRIGRLRRSYG